MGKNPYGFVDDCSKRLNRVIKTMVMRFRSIPCPPVAAQASSPMSGADLRQRFPCRILHCAENHRRIQRDCATDIVHATMRLRLKHSPVVWQHYEVILTFLVVSAKMTSHWQIEPIPTLCVSPSRARQRPTLERHEV